MLISYNWLKTLIDVPTDVDQLSDLLTNTGLEVEKVTESETVKGGLRGLLIGEVVTCEKHPDADRLSVTTVNLGNETRQIVCGAPNVAVGQKVVVAPVGCTIHPLEGEPFEIKNAKIRGVASEGMICAEDEIGLGKSHAGILVLNTDARIGSAAADYFKLASDHRIEIGLTPNRGDATGHLGVARDVRAVTGKDIRMSAVSTPNYEGSSIIAVELPEPEKCPRYTGILLNNVKVAESPDWLKNRLRSIDLKPINNVVDVTNFVLHELGQPIHAFDASKIAGGIIRVRTSKNGEKITTLDGVNRTLTGKELLIADAEKALAIAGVFGGQASGVTNETTSVFIESAYFDPGTIRASAKSQGLSTDASFRYERGCDPEITTYALCRVVDLLSETAGAKIGSPVIDAYPTVISKKTIALDLSWMSTFLGADIPITEVKRILTLLDFEILPETQPGICQLKAPLYRSDVTRRIDVAEEVLRIYGYNRVEIPQQLRFTPAAQSGGVNIQRRISTILNGFGFLEIMNNSLTKSGNHHEEVVILNPLSNEMAVMRTSLLPAVLDVVRYNINRKNTNLLFYEFGKTYRRHAAGFEEKNELMVLCTGSLKKANWITSYEKSDDYVMLGLQNALAQSFGLSLKAIQKISAIASIKGSDLKKHDLKQEVFYLQVDIDRLKQHMSNSVFRLKDIPVFPVVVRDLSTVIDEEVSFAQIREVVQQSAGKYFYGIEVFDVYRGDRLPAGKKAYACSISLYDEEKTMTDKLTDGIMQKMMLGLEKNLNAMIRQ